MATLTGKAVSPELAIRRTARRSGRGLRLSIITPVLNEEGVIDLYLAKMRPSLEQALVRMGEGADYEIVFVDDGSTDATYSELLALAGCDERIKVLRLSRNFGKDAALAAGLRYVTGDAAVPVDVDLQDPPEVIVDMVEAWINGAQVVNAVRVDRRSDSNVKRWTAKAFYWLFNRIATYSVPNNVGDFRLLDRETVDAVNRLSERVRFMKGLISWVGYETVSINYVRPARAAGTTKWNYWRLWNFALDGITGATTIPLRIWTYVGLSVAVTALAMAVYIVGETLLFGRDVPGYASLMTVVLLLGAFQLISLGVLGEYVGRIANEVRQRPLFIVRDTVGFEPRDDIDDEL